MNAQEYLQEWDHGEKVMLMEKVAALEGLVIELALIAMKSENTPQGDIKKLNELLGKLEYAGLEELESMSRNQEQHLDVGPP